MENLKDLKVKNIDIQNVKNIDYLNYTFSDWVVIGGHNQSGKSTFVDSIFGAIMSNKFFGTSPTKIVKEGEHKAIITMQLHNKDKEITIERTFKKGTEANIKGTSKLLAYFGDNPKDTLKQSDLDRLVSILTIDPLRLQNLNVPDQIKEVQTITGLDTSEIDKELVLLEDERLQTNRGKKEHEANYDLVTKAGIPDKVERVDINKLIQNIDLFNPIQLLENKMGSKLSEKERLEEEIAKLQTQLETVEAEGGEIYVKLEADKDDYEKAFGTIESNKSKLANAQDINIKADLYENFIQAKADKKMYQDDFEKCDFDVKLKQKERVEFIKTSKMPEYMTIDSLLGVLVDGIEYKQLNTARKLQVAMDLNVISGSPLKVIRIEEGGELDINALKSIQDEILDKGYQIFIERAVIDEFDVIIMDEGELVDDDGEIEKLIEAEKLKETEIANSLKK